MKFKIEYDCTPEDSVNIICEQLNKIGLSIEYDPKEDVDGEVGYEIIKIPSQ